MAAALQRRVRRAQRLCRPHLQHRTLNPVTSTIRPAGSSGPLTAQLLLPNSMRPRPWVIGVTRQKRRPTAGDPRRWRPV